MAKLPVKASGEGRKTLYRHNTASVSRQSEWGVEKFALFRVQTETNKP